jgi:hypothetical protein
MMWLLATLAGKKPNIDRVWTVDMLLGEARHVCIAHQFRRRRDATLGHSRRQGKRWDQGGASEKETADN